MKIFNFGINRCDLNYKYGSKDIGQVYLKLTCKCPNNCSFCIERFNVSPDLPFEKLMERFEYYINLPTNKNKTGIVIGGGEPLIEQDLLYKVLLDLKSKYPGKKLFLATSLPKLSYDNKELTYKIFDLCYEIDISMHGLNNEDDSKIYRRENNYDKLGFIKELASKYSNKIYISTVVIKSYYDTDKIRSRINLLKSIGIKKMTFSEVCNTRHDCSESDPEYVPLSEVFPKEYGKLDNQPYISGCSLMVKTDDGLELYIRRACFLRGGNNGVPSTKEFIKCIINYIINKWKGGDK